MSEENNSLSTERHNLKPWAARLIDRPTKGSLVAIAREGRLVREGNAGPIAVQLTPIDESALALVDLALTKRKHVNFFYPAPAGEVSVLLAAEILLHWLIERRQSPAVGLVTADTTAASRTWEELRIVAPGTRQAIAEVFPCVRCGPEGESPLGRQRFRCLIVGQHYANWPVDIVVVDHLAGPASENPPVPTIHVYADPLDETIKTLISQGRLIWSWSAADLAYWYTQRENHHDGSRSSSPFSVSHERLSTVANGIKTTVRIVQTIETEKCVARIRDDLRTLTELAGPTPERNILRGLRVAWHHLSTLASLPCRPSEFDLFTGRPPIAARPTHSFEAELTAWAKMLPSDFGELASILASDLGELRCAVEDENPFFPELKAAANEQIETIATVRTHTAARALLHVLGGGIDSDSIGHLTVRSLRRLHKEGTWDRAIVVGNPPRWDWHRLDSGLSSNVQVLVIGIGDANRCRNTLSELTDARRRLGSAELKALPWRELVSEEPPSELPPEVDRLMEISITEALQSPPKVDPFESFEPLLGSSPLLVGDEGLEESVAEETEDGTWTAAVEAVEIETDNGFVLLPLRRVVEARLDEKIIECSAEDLKPGMYLFIGRKEGRIGLLEALAERLTKHRPDIVAGLLLVRDLQMRVIQTFKSSGMTKAELFRRLEERGFDKTYQAARGYVEDDGPLAPRDADDLERLNDALRLGLSRLRVIEIFRGVHRLRVFRRAAGRALAAAARASTIAEDLTRVDPETGLSLADLRDVVQEAKVVRVTQCPELVPLADVGRLRPDPD